MDLENASKFCTVFAPVERRGRHDLRGAKHKSKPMDNPMRMPFMETSAIGRGVGMSYTSVLYAVIPVE